MLVPLNTLNKFYRKSVDIPHPLSSRLVVETRIGVPSF